MENESTLTNVNFATPVKLKGFTPGKAKGTSEKSLKQIAFAQESIVDAVDDSKSLDEEKVESLVVEEDEKVENDEESTEDAEQAEADAVRKQQHEAHTVQLQEEQIQHLHLKTMTLQRSLEILQKQHEKDMKLKDIEISEQRKRAQKCKEEEDQIRVEFQRQKIKLETTSQSQINQLKAEVSQAKTLATSGPGASFAAGKSFSMKSFLSSSKSQKLQAKVQANASERDHARALQSLQAEVAKLTTRNNELTRERQLWIDIGAARTTEVANLEQEADLFRSKLNQYSLKLKKATEKIKAYEREKEDLVMKAGWAAEQLQMLTGELEYERSKHVKPSRLQVLRQTEELQKVKEENELLKKGQSVPKENPVNVVSLAKKGAKAPMEAKAADAAYSSATSHVVEAPLLGTETIAELVALKAKQREQRAIKMDTLIKKNQEMKEKRKSIEDPNVPVSIDKVFKKAMGTRREFLHEESSIVSQASTENEW